MKTEAQYGFIASMDQSSPQHNPARVGIFAFLDNGKEYPASPSSLRGLRPTLLHVVATTSYSHNEFKAYNIDIKSQSVN